MVLHYSPNHTEPLVFRLLALLIVLASHQQKGGERAQAQQAASRDIRGTPQSPVVVKVLPGEKSKEAAEAERAEKDKHAHAESLVAYGTLALAIATGVLMLGTLFLAGYTYQLWKATGVLATGASKDANVQAGLTRQAILQAERSATAAQRSVQITAEGLASAAIDSAEIRAVMDKQATAATESAKAGRASERAYVLINAPGTIHENSGRAWQDDAVFFLHFTNFGKTPAKIDEIVAFAEYWESVKAIEDLDAVPERESDRLDGIWLAANAPMGIHRVKLAASPEQIARAKARNGCLAILGKVVYTDVFLAQHEFRFAGVLREGPPYFEWVKNDKLNYSN